jgi:CBS domain-containing protein
MSMQAKDVMRGNPLTVGPDASISEAIAIMDKSGASGLPVVDANGQLVGILTEGDLLRRVETGTERHRQGWLELLVGPVGTAADYVRSHTRRVGDLMTRDVVTVSEDAPLEEVVELMERKHVKRVPVVGDGKVIGIVSRADLVRAVGRALAQEQTGSKADEAIRTRLYSELSGQSWFRAQDVTAGVENGVVTLKGFIGDESTRAAFRVAAANVPGVVAVEDKLVLAPVTPGLAF